MRVRRDEEGRGRKGKRGWRGKGKERMGGQREKREEKRERMKRECTLKAYHYYTNTHQKLKKHASKTKGLRQRTERGLKDRTGDKKGTVVFGA